MLILNVKALLESRGHGQPQAFLRGHGFSNYTLCRIFTNKTVSITYATLEKLCLLCQCTPDELFVWVPDEGTPVPPEHPMHKLKPKPKVANPVERIKRLSPAKLKELQEVLDRLERGGSVD